MRSALLLALGTLATVVGWGGGRLGAEETESLAGGWRYELDRSDTGIEQRWYHRPLALSLTLPGSLPGEGIGDEITDATKWMGKVDRAWYQRPEFRRFRQAGRIEVPFFLQPATYYAGVAWYQRELDIPSAWTGRSVGLILERPHWETRVWLDDRLVGSNDSLSTPHVYRLGFLAPGTHRLTVRVDNRMVVNVGIDAHSITDQAQGDWNGIVGQIDLVANQPAWLGDLEAYPHADRHSVVIRGSVAGAVESVLDGKVRLSATLFNVARPAGWKDAACAAAVSRDGTFEVECPLGPNAPCWDEFNPALYRLTATLANGESRTITFGLRDFGTRGTQFVLNGRLTFIRGTHEGCEFPLTGHPPMDVASWKRIIGVAKSYGLNLFRFHSWCPPEAAFVAADEMGFYYSVECAAWPCRPITLGDGLPVDAWLYREGTRILEAYGNHPSFMLMLSGNEPEGKHQVEYLAKWVAHFRAADSRRLYSSASGHPVIPENQFEVSNAPRIQHWAAAGYPSRVNEQPPATVADYRDYVAKCPAPVISHETGQWAAYPDLTQASKYTGYLKPKYFDIWSEVLNAHHLADREHDFVMASGRLQVLLYKEEIESALRTPGMGGFELLDLHDYPGQGLAPVGVLDVFWNPKGYTNAAEYTEFCNRTVPLVRLAQRVFRTDEAIDAEVEVAHFGPAPLVDERTAWRLVGDDGQVLAAGHFPERTIPIGNGTALGRIRCELSRARAPARYSLKVKLENSGYHNEWNVWVYPRSPETQPPSGIIVTRALDAPARAALAAGQRVILFIPPSLVRGDARGGSAFTFSSVFWSSFWSARQPLHTLGILCDPRHPALAEFPTEEHSDWQWWYLTTRSGAMILDGLPTGLRPIVAVIDNWVDNRRLGLLFEAKVGKGRLLVCSMDLGGTDPVAPQMLASLYAYVAGPAFHPAVDVSLAQIDALMLKPGEKIVPAPSHQPANPFQF